MCSTTALFATSQVADAIAGGVQANAQNKYNKAVSKQNEAAIRENLNANLNLLGQQSIQERQAAAARLEGIRRQARNAEGTALASAGASGVSGNSLSFLADAYERALQESATNTAISLKNSEGQRRAQAQGLVANAQAGLFSNLPQKVQGPGYLDLLKIGLDVGSFALDQNSKDN